MTIKRIQAYTLSELIDKANELTDRNSKSAAERAAEKAEHYVIDFVIDDDFDYTDSGDWSVLLYSFGFTNPGITSYINDSPEDAAVFTSHVDISKLIAWLVDTEDKPMRKSMHLTEEECQDIQDGFDAAKGTEHEYTDEEEFFLFDEKAKEKGLEYFNYILGRPEQYYPKANDGNQEASDRKFRNELDWLQWVNPDDRWFCMKVVRQVGLRNSNIYNTTVDFDASYYESPSDRELIDEKIARLADAIDLINVQLCTAMTSELQKRYRAALSTENLIAYADECGYLFAADGTPIHHLIEEEETPETPE